MKKIFKVLTISGLTTSMALSGFLLLNSQKDNKSCCNANEQILQQSKSSKKSNSNLQFKLSTDFNQNIDISDESSNNVDSYISNPIISDPTTIETDNQTNIGQQNNIEYLQEQLDEINTNILGSNEMTSDTTIPSDLTEDENLEIDVISDEIGSENDEESVIDEPKISEENIDELIDETQNEIIDEETVTEEGEIQDETNDEMMDENTNNIDFEIILNNYNKLIENYNSLLETINTLNNEYNGHEFDFDDEMEDELEEKIEELNTLQREVHKSIDALNENFCDDCNNHNFLYHFMRDINFKIMDLQNAYNSLFANNQMVYSYSPYSNPNANIYGYYYSIYPKYNESNEQNSNLDDIINEPSLDESLEETTENSNEEELDNINEKEELDDTSSDGLNTKKTTTNSSNKKNGWLVPNIDTYGPRYRNIDTFFNTALLDDDMLEGYNNGFGYPMPYMYGNAYWNNDDYEFNSNNGYFNPNFVNDNSNNMNNGNNFSQTANTTNIDGNQALNDLTPPEQSNPKRKKFAKNIDSYKDKTMDANVNTMGGIKVTDYLKNKFTSWFKKDSVKNNLQQEVETYVDDFIESNQNNEQKHSSMFEPTTIDNTSDNNNQENQEETFQPPQLRKIEKRDVY